MPKRSMDVCVTGRAATHQHLSLRQVRQCFLPEEPRLVPLVGSFEEASLPQSTPKGNIVVARNEGNYFIHMAFLVFFLKITG